MQMEMADLRAAIDATDEQIIALLATRFTLTYQVGLWKARVGEGALNAGRQAQRARLLEALALRHGLDYALVVDLFARIQRDTVASHIRLAAARPT